MQRITNDFEEHLKLKEEYDDQEIESHVEEDVDDDDEEDEEGEEEFSFTFDGVNFSSISAEDAFDNGQIKPVFPLFNRDILLGADAEDYESLRLKDRLPNVKNVFVEAEEDDLHPTTSSSSAADGDVAGPYCEWSKKVVEAAPAPEGCKKSNSTGFSKIWRFKDFMHRSNSDGRDAFVFLNHPPTPSKAGAVNVTREEKAAVEGVSIKKVTGTSGGVGGEVGKVKKVKKTSKSAALSPLEVYMRSKTKDAERRRSYLPYRPDFVGLFTNVNGGGLTKNVHPF